jgi:hypothetical protein
MKLIKSLIKTVSVSLPGIVMDFLDLIFQTFFVLIIITIATYFNIKTYFTYFIAFSLYWIVKSLIYTESKLSINKFFKNLSLIIKIVLIITVGLYLFDIQIFETINSEGGGKINIAVGKARIAREKTEIALMKGNTTASSSQNTPDLPEIQKSNVFDFLTDYINTFCDYLNTLDFIHNYALVNLLLLTAVCLCLLHIFFLGYSDYLITKFKLESRFPKFAGIIKARSLITTGSLFGYIVVLICLLLFGIFLNTAILLL